MSLGGGAPYAGFWRRAAASFISLLSLGLGFLWVARDPRKQGFHDKLAKTVVVLEDPLRMPLPDIDKEFR